MENTNKTYYRNKKLNDRINLFRLVILFKYYFNNLNFGF